MAAQVPISRKAFNERLLETLTVPQAEREQLLDQARKEGAAFARDLTDRLALVLLERWVFHGHHDHA